MDNQKERIELISSIVKMMEERNTLQERAMSITLMMQEIANRIAYNEFVEPNKESKGV